MADQRQFAAEGVQFDDQPTAYEFAAEGVQFNETTVAAAVSDDVLPQSLSHIETGVIASRAMHTIEQGFIA